MYQSVTLAIKVLALCNFACLLSYSDALVLECVDTLAVATQNKKKPERCDLCQQRFHFLLLLSSATAEQFHSSAYQLKLQGEEFNNLTNKGQGVLETYWLSCSFCFPHVCNTLFFATAPPTDA